MIQALRGMGYTEQADHYTHFSYEMVALTPRCAVELGYDVSEEDKKKSYIEVSGRKGFGVKADDLIDKLIAATRAEVDARQTRATKPCARRSPNRSPSARCATSCSSSRATPSSPSTSKTRSASKARPAPTFNTPSCASATSSAKANTTPEAVLAELAELAEPDESRIALFLSGEENEDIWALWLRAGRFSLVLEQCIATSEPAYLAKHAFQLAQEFANFYHRHHILTEEDPARKTFLLATAAVTLRELVGSLALLGIESPEAM